MKKLWFFFSCSVPLLTASFLLACGTSNRLESISIRPATASGQAQYTATGTYTDGSKVTPLPALWSERNPWSMGPIGNEIKVDANGMASCGTVAGTFPVMAIAPIDPHFLLSKMGPTVPQLSGTAQLTCP